MGNPQVHHALLDCRGGIFALGFLSMLLQGDSLPGRWILSKYHSSFARCFPVSLGGSRKELGSAPGYAVCHSWIQEE